jgi:L-rhamnose mutarotase
MIRIGRLVGLKSQEEERYIIIHKQVWPGVLDRIYKSNIRNYSIFLLDNILFSYNEYVGQDYAADMDAGADEITREWWKLTDPMQNPLPSRKEGEWWLTLDLISHFDEIVKPYQETKRIAFVAEVKPGTEDAIKKHFVLFEQNAIHLFKEAGLQNQSVFLDTDRLYVYVEYTGNNFAEDDKALNNKLELKKWNDQLEEYLKVTWREMKEVFHTD